MKWAIVLALTACGRIGFDPATGAPPSSDANARDGTPGDGTGMTADAFASVCANAMTVTVGSTPVLDTCTGTADNIDACSTGKRELVFRFVPPMTRAYSIRARDAGTQNISNSTARMDSACLAKMGGCTGLLGTTLTAGQTYYFVVEASAAACASIEFDIQ